MEHETFCLVKSHQVAQVQSKVDTRAMGARHGCGAPRNPTNLRNPGLFIEVEALE